ncbi:MAG: FHA domain-containing protein [Deltaproteobacteria bacterium]|nr:MAG: FHA domain-containing protein [Deltaproteobacteria bacterium]
MIVHNITILDASGQVVDEFGFSRGEVILGRGADCDVRLESSAVSRKHARIRVEGPQCSIEDLGSSNGIFVQDQRIQQPVLLPPQCTIVIGDFVVEYASASTAGQDAPSAPSQPSALPPSLPTSGPPPRPSNPMPARPWYLIRFGDHLEGEYFELSETELSLGRTDANLLQVLDPSVSRVHAHLRLQGDHFVLVDNRSANGTRVNGVRVERAMVLREGDRVSFGDIRFAVTTDPTNFRFAETVGSTTSVTRPQAPGGSSNTLLLLVSAIASMLLIAGAIGLLLLAPSGPGMEDPPSAFEVAMAEMSRGERAMDQQDWMGAVAAFEAAQLAAPSRDTAQRLEAARAELAASEQLQICTAQLEAALNLEASGQTLVAAETYEDARTCHEALPTSSSSHEVAQQRIATQIDPALSTLYRQLGTLSLRNGDYAAALQTLERAAALLAEADEPVPATLNARLREALIAVADDAFEEEQWSRAAELYNRAGAIAPLDAAQSRRQSRATSRAR